MKPFLLIGVGSAFGGICRYLMQVYIGRYLTMTFPVGTFIVNVTGCFLIGLLYGIATKHPWLTLEWRLLLITGVCGGYTTFSSFSFESMTLLRQGNYTYFFLYAIGSVAIGLLATIAGSAVVR